MKESAILALADGSVYKGTSIGHNGRAVGELVFNTAITGYQEILTDPSYCGQIVTLTMPHIGNTGCNEQDMESNAVWASGLIVRDRQAASNWRSQEELEAFLKRNNTVAIADLDTRALTHWIREHGAQGACISTDCANPQAAIELAQSFEGLHGKDLAAKVSTEAPYEWHEGRGEWQEQGPTPGRFNVVAYDFGIKKNIMRIMADKGCRLQVVPAKTPLQDVLKLNPDGIFFSNGPGDPQACEYAIHTISALLDKDIPLFGICLGFQLLASACGAKTVKMKFGHHGSNHPVVSLLENNRVSITSQNHGFAVDEASLPEDLVVTHRSLFDNTLQGFRHKHKPLLGFQGHPEASPGPHDLLSLFDEFMFMMDKRS